jgi:hypothetical protein
MAGFRPESRSRVFCVAVNAKSNDSMLPVSIVNPLKWAAGRALCRALLASCQAIRTEKTERRYAGLLSSAPFKPQPYSRIRGAVKQIARKITQNLVYQHFILLDYGMEKQRYTCRSENGSESFICGVLGFAVNSENPATRRRPPQCTVLASYISPKVAS